jgi:hypothetical protein
MSSSAKESWCERALLSVAIGPSGRLGGAAQGSIRIGQRAPSLIVPLPLFLGLSLSTKTFKHGFNSLHLACRLVGKEVVATFGDHGHI